jgi:hypothetical protein
MGITPWAAYTPTINWDNNEITGMWRMVGDTLEARVRIKLTDTPSQNSYLVVGIPTGLSLDPAKLLFMSPTDYGYSPFVGSGSMRDGNEANDGRLLGVFLIETFGGLQRLDAVGVMLAAESWFLNKKAGGPKTSRYANGTYYSFVMSEFRRFNGTFIVTTVE